MGNYVLPKKLKSHLEIYSDNLWQGHIVNIFGFAGCIISMVTIQLYCCNFIYKNKWQALFGPQAVIF